MATKQDIQDITDKIEAVKNTYSKSLEILKQQLQNQRDILKPSIKAANKMDEELIQLINEGKKERQQFYLDRIDGDLTFKRVQIVVESLLQIFRHLNCHIHQYGHLECVINFTDSLIAYKSLEKRLADGDISVKEDIPSAVEDIFTKLTNLADYFITYEV